jgi:hypothetical protein
MPVSYIKSICNGFSGRTDLRWCAGSLHTFGSAVWSKKGEMVQMETSFQSVTEYPERNDAQGIVMRLIDGLIHAFHIAAISGKRGRPVGVNLIQGTKTQIIELIEELSGN